MASYALHQPSNVCALDWARLALTEYTIAANNTRLVARQLHRFLRRLNRVHALPLAAVTLVGHSFGAQIAGMVGAKMHGKIGRIIGLDPAGWLFTKPDLVAARYRLDRGDAKFVQCIHTNANYVGLGTDVACGHQDFYPNEGLSPQPGCERPAEQSGLTHSILQYYFLVTQI